MTSAVHELSVMMYLLEAVEAHARCAGAKKVLTITLVIGERTSIMDDAVLFYFDALTPGTLAEGARLHVRRTQTQFHCAACDADYLPSGGDFRCPRCRGLGRVTDDGNDLLLESMEVET
ncbi:MAG: hydrogenase maturation nickel metallochaperone HypA/HybF [Thermomicrobiales bacterium]